MLYFLVHDAALFCRFSRAFATSWRTRDFAPVAKLAGELQPTFVLFADRFRLTKDELPLLADLAPDRPFGRRLWRHLAGEILLYASSEAPAIQTACEDISAFVSLDQRHTIQRAHEGSHDLDFDGIPYRPGYAGLNDVADVARIAEELAKIDPNSWNPRQLASCEDSVEELEFARECFASIRNVYDAARLRGQVVVCEDF